MVKENIILSIFELIRVRLYTSTGHVRPEAEMRAVQVASRLSEEVDDVRTPNWSLLILFCHLMVTFWSDSVFFVVYFFAFSGWSSSSLAGLCFCSQRLVLLKRRCFTKGAFFVVSCIFMLRDQDQELHPHHRHDGKMILLKQCFCRLTRKHARTFWWWQVGLGGNPYVQILSKSYSLSHGQSFVGQRFLQPEMDSEAKWCDFFHHSSRLLPNYVAPSICQPMNQVLRLAWYENDILVFSQCCIAALMSKHFMIKVAERKWMKMPCLR